MEKRRLIRLLLARQVVRRVRAAGPRSDGRFQTDCREEGLDTERKKMPRSSPERRFEESFKETGKTRGSGRQVAERRRGDLEMLAV